MWSPMYYTSLKSAHQDHSNDTHIAKKKISRKNNFTGGTLLVQKGSILTYLGSLGGLNQFFRKKFFSILHWYTHGTNFSHEPLKILIMTKKRDALVMGIICWPHFASNRNNGNCHPHLFLKRFLQIWGWISYIKFVDACSLCLSPQLDTQQRWD